MGEDVTVPQVCPRCKATGFTTWKKFHGHAILVATDDSFFERVKRKYLSATELVCAKCGKTQAPPQLP